MRSRPIPTESEGISAEVIYHMIDDQEVKTLLVDFGEERPMLSTACGYKRLRYAANHYIPSVLWEQGLDHNHFDEYLTRVFDSIHQDQKNVAMLVTAVDMDNLAYRYANYRGLMIGCFATAGVKGNAMRMGVDKAQVEGPGLSPPGTINVMLLTNANLSDGAMAMALINITEAKAGVLQT